MASRWHSAPYDAPNERVVPPTRALVGGCGGRRRARNARHCRFRSAPLSGATPVTGIVGAPRTLRLATLPLHVEVRYR